MFKNNKINFPFLWANLSSAGIAKEYIEYYVLSNRSNCKWWIEKNLKGNPYDLLYSSP
jgi:hypothetical protein